MDGLGIVIIGRNEGERLKRCLASIPAGPAVVYVDSGSSDDSVLTALSLGAKVVQLDMMQPFTAARARNAGRIALPHHCGFAQFVDGDCALQPGWLVAAMAAVSADPGLAAVFGRRREIAPQASWYNWLCDVEWTVRAGPAQYFGGDVMIRLAALDQAGGYPDGMIAGEEPDLAIRMRKLGWRLACLQHEMTLHDAAITQFGQWWRRSIRSGHAYAELAARNRDFASQDYPRRLFGALFWGAALPIGGLAFVAAALMSWDSRTGIIGCFLLILLLAQLVRLWLREARHRPLANALILASFLMLAKPAQAVGIARYWRGKLMGKRSTIIEYK